MARGRILVIDDEKDLIELVRYNLEKEGFLVRIAQDGESGLSADDARELFEQSLTVPPVIHPVVRVHPTTGRRAFRSSC